MICSTTSSSNLIDIVPGIVSIINIIIIIYIFISQKKYQKKINLFTKKSIWFYKLIIESHMDDIDKFFNFMEINIPIHIEYLTKFRSNNTVPKFIEKSRERIRQIKQEADKFDKNIIDLVRSINLYLGNEISSIVEGLIDTITEEINDLLTDDKPRTKRQKYVREYRIKLIKKLYQYDLKETK